ncbi:hypothetical protein [Marmoricola sp. URHB0036]|jgi:hypothetical protein|uniref:hypothetical protein n=1 Tax=Marmoricola sp. URHB0036 TaxID=1298863 RepID=UPI0004081267|nr:hypothetical protein [Marmoricola sp. URHB0036]
MLDDQPISYEQWGVDFFREAISEERVLGAVNTITGQPVELGPIGAGPGKIAKVRAYGEIGAARSSKADGDQIGYRLVLPVALTFEVDLQVGTDRFEADLLVPLALTAHARSGVRIFIEVQPPRPDDVEVEVRAQGRRASVLQRVAGIEGEVRRIVAEYVWRELDKPHVLQARSIDVSHAISEVWASISPTTGQDGGADLEGR